MADEKEPKEEKFSLADAIKNAPTLGAGQPMSKMTDDSPLDMGNVWCVVEEFAPDGWSAQFKAARGSGAQATAQVILEGPHDNVAAFPITTVGELKKVLKYFCTSVTLVYHTDAWHSENSKVLLGVAHGFREACDLINFHLDDDENNTRLNPEECQQLQDMQQTQTSGDRSEGEFVLERHNVHRRMRE